MDPADFLRKCLIEARIEGEGIRRFEERLGFTEGALREIMNEEKPQIPRLDKAAKIAEALGLEFYLGPIRPTDPSASSTIAGALQSPVVLGFQTAAGVDGNVGMKLDGREWSGQLLLSPELARYLSASLARRALEIEEPE